MITAKEVRSILEQAFTEARVQVHDYTGTQDHYQLTVVTPDFAGKKMVEQHQMVNGALSKELLSEAIHAVVIKTYTPEQWEKFANKK
ncbi:MAG: BolA family transcriptional regulator [Myxococcales bacterium]|nr:BolA family transcriptional regulator [Myxococcales bacterium]